MHITQVLKKPLLTEKSYSLISKNVFTFIVDKNAKKPEIKKAFETIFEVKVAKVNVCNYIKKAKRVGKFFGYKSSYKKAIITLKKGEKLSLFDDEGLSNNKKEK